MSLIKSVGAGEQSTGFYKHLLDQSLKFDDGKNNYLTRTPASAGNRKTFTYSSWVKRGKISADNPTWGITAGTLNNSSNVRTEMRFSSTDTVGIGFNTGSWYESYTNAKFRDTSAWYHFVVSVDMTQSTASDRLKFYVNGVLQTFSAYSVPNQNTDLPINNTLQHAIGDYVAGESSASYQFDGYLAEINFIDGTALTADSFGETIEGIWTPRDTSGLTFGTNGFHLTFKDDVVSEGFNTVTYTGTGATQSISGLGFSPAFVWVKVRDGTNNHRLFDVVRGATKDLISNSTSSESTTSVRLQSFDGDGFTVGTNAEVNASGGDIVAWCWQAGGTPTADNSASAGATPTAGSVKIDGSNLGSALAGSIPATRLSANTSKGFSIVSYTGNGTGGSTIGHGLSGVDMLIIKDRDSAQDWNVYHKDVGTTNILALNSTSAAYGDGAAMINSTAPSASVITLGVGGASNGSGRDYIAYCFAEVSGYSKFGSYSGNGSASGPSVTLGFEPSWIMIRRTDSANNWVILDTTRDPDGQLTKYLVSDYTQAESDSAQVTTQVDANGFTIKSGFDIVNASGGTYIYMAFGDTREAAFFKDVTTNGNNFTPVNLDYRDSVPDTPTNNFCTWNTLDKYNYNAPSEGNLRALTAGNNGTQNSTFAVSSGKWYWEARNQSAESGSMVRLIGIAKEDTTITSTPYSNSDCYLYYGADGNKYNGSGASYGNSFSADGDIVGVAFDADNGALWFSKNGTWQNSATASEIAAGTTTNSAFTGISGTYVMMVSKTGGTSSNDGHHANFGQDSTFAGSTTTGGNSDSGGIGDFKYAPPSGFLALCSQNLPDVEIIDGTENFNTVTYTGTGATTLSITGVGFSPDWVWAKKRSASDNHAVSDTVRGVTKTLFPNTNGAESTDAQGLRSFDSDGFTIGSGSGSGVWGGNSGATYVAWNWLAGTAFSNSAGANGATIASSGQVNTKAGFSIVSYTGTGSNASVGHSLGVQPSMIIAKRRDATENWPVYHTSTGSSQYAYLDNTQAFSTATSVWQGVDPTSSVFSIGSSGTTNASGGSYIAYCFHSVEGYSKVGSYVGNGSADGPFVYTGFRPAWVMIKLYNAAGVGWGIYDSARDSDNVVKQILYANDADDESTYSTVLLDFLSNGFKLRGNYSTINGSYNYTYLAFAEQPFKFSNAR